MPEAIATLLMQAGVPGAIVLWFMYRDGKERDRQAERDAARELQMDRMTEALNHLIRITGIEVMSRPDLTERTREETRELVAAVDRRRQP